MTKKHNQLRKIFYGLLFSLVAQINTNTTIAAPLVFETNQLNGEIAVKSWKDFRDKSLVKQQLDYSCGAASIATILTEYYQQPTTEKKVLKAIGKSSKASFANMREALKKLGYKGVGIATSWEQLTKLKIPVILYVKQRKTDHFTVVSGINDTHIKLSDSSLGNRILTRGQFKKIWETRKDKELKGKMLAILPLKKKANVNQAFFSPPKFYHVPTDMLLMRDF